MMATLLAQGMTLGFMKGVKLSECGLLGELRSFILTLVPNAALFFWACSMWMNY